MFEIGKVAEITGLSPHTLRAWEKRYNIKPACRTESGRRLYDHHTVDHLKLLKHCSDLGYSIGNTAHLPTLELQKLIETSRSDSSHSSFQKHRNERLFVVMVNLDKSREPAFDLFKDEYKEITCVHLEKLDDLSGYLSNPQADCDYAVGAYNENLSEEAFPIFSMLRAQNIPTLLCYNFGRLSIRKSYESLGVYLQKAPLQGEWIRPLVTELQRNWPNHNAQNENEARGAFQLSKIGIAQKIFTPETLDWINLHPVNLKCECPNHISELIIKLNAFETYSQKCLTQSPDDIELHQDIYEKTALARHMLETLLVNVLKNEGIDHNNINLN